MKKIIGIMLLCILILMIQGCDTVDEDTINEETGTTEFTEESTTTLTPEPEPEPLSAEQIFELVSPSVVEIVGKVDKNQSTGTGFFIDDKGTVMTNYHVIAYCTSAEITVSDGKKYAVKNVLGYSEEKDIAILSTRCTSSVPLSIRKTEVKTGESVYAIGSSLGLSSSLSNGIVSAAKRVVDKMTYIQTTAPISHGNSGGPLIDKNGNVIGITSASFIEGQNLNLAIPITEADTVSTESPIALSELFKSIPTYITHIDVSQKDENGRYCLSFSMLDQNERYMSMDGTVSIKIINFNDEEVFSDTISFSKSDFKNDGVLCLYVYFNHKDISEGSTDSGMVHFTVSSIKSSTKDLKIGISGLPVVAEQMFFTLPDLPSTVNTISTRFLEEGKIYSKAKIVDITFDYTGTQIVEIHFKGIKSYDKDGKSGRNRCVFRWELLDEDGTVVGKGLLGTYPMFEGETFDVSACAYDLRFNGKYTVVISDGTEI